MKKLLVFVVFVVALLAQAQTVGEVGLTEVETLKVSNLAKDVQIAIQQIQILQANFDRLVTQRNASQTAFLAMVERLRVAHQAPEDKFTFDAVRFTFVPVPLESNEEKE